MRDDMATRFSGGSFLAAVVRLAVLSLIVGALMSWFGIDPADLVTDLQRLILNLWNNGFVALRDIGRTVGAGAVVVLPIWLVLRVLSYRGPRRGPADVAPPRASRWSAFGPAREERRREP